MSNIFKLNVSNYFAFNFSNPSNQIISLTTFSLLKIGFVPGPGPHKIKPIVSRHASLLHK